MKYIACTLFISHITSYADQVPSLSVSQPVITEVQSPKLSQIDNANNDINQLKQQLELNKLHAEINKIRPNIPKSKMEVVSIAIDKSGHKFAHVRIDNELYEITINSKILNMRVLSIDMDGITCALPSGRKKTLKYKCCRVYSWIFNNMVIYFFIYFVYL
jgi:hypothetical protein